MENAGLLSAANFYLGPFLELFRPHLASNLVNSAQKTF